MTNKELLVLFRNSKYINFIKFLENNPKVVEQYRYPCYFCKEAPCGEEHCERNKLYEERDSINNNDPINCNKLCYSASGKECR